MELMPIKPYTMLGEEEGQGAEEGVYSIVVDC